MCKSGIEHLHDKLRHIKISKGLGPQAQVDVSSDEYVLDMMSRCEERLLQLMEQLSQIDIDTQLHKMQEEEVRIFLLKLIEIKIALLILIDYLDRKLS